MTPEQRVLRERCKPKVEPTTDKMGPLYDMVEHAIELIDCAWYVLQHSDFDNERESTTAVRRVIDDGSKLLGTVRDQLHDMVAWAR